MILRSKIKNPAPLSRQANLVQGGIPPYKKDSLAGEESGVCGRARAVANPTVQVSFQKNSPIASNRATLKMAPHLEDQRTFSIILPNTIHGCKKKDL